MFVLTSPDFNSGEAIPARCTCDGANVSPGLNWSGVPAGCVELLLVCEDPDAPTRTFYHWAAYGLRPDRTGLPAGFSRGADAAGFHQAVNDFGIAGYGGPCPPRGDRPHLYLFRLSALKAPLSGAGPDTTCAEIVRAAAPLVIETAELVGTYTRKRG